MRPLALALAALALAAAPASAFVRSRTDKGTPIAWPGSCVWVQTDSAGAIDLSLPTTTAIVAKAIANWQSVTLEASPPCSYLRINLDPPTPSEAHLDHLNVVKFRSDKWCRPAEGMTAEMCYSSVATAITTIFYDSAPGKSNDGNIVDADIELNELNFTFVWLGNEVPPIRDNTMKADLENTLTHEVGHLQGLDHTCWDNSTGNDPVDDKGMAVPTCSDVIAHHVSDADYQRIVQSSMYNYAQPTEVIKRMPKADDIAGICAIYPAAKDPKSCNRPAPPGKGCEMARGQGGSTAPGLMLIAIAAFVLSRARHRR